MQQVRKKKRKQIPVTKRVLLILGICVLMLGVVLSLYAVLRKEAVPQVLYREMTEGTLTAYKAEQVDSVSVKRRDGTGWRIFRDSGGNFRGEQERVLDPDGLEMILNVTASVGWERILTEDPSDWKENTAAFGLDLPRLTVTVSYHDQTDLTFHIGNDSGTDDENFCYMSADGDDRLFALDRGTYDTLNIDESMLYEVPDPGIHRGRIDRIRILDGSGTVSACWELRADITDEDNADSWFVTEPFVYPADGEIIGHLRSNLANMSLGNWICSAENVPPEYGFDRPSGKLEVHMNAGSIGTVDREGKYTVTDWPESEFVLTVGNHRNGMTSYVMADGNIYAVSDLILSGLMNARPEDTVSKYLVTEPLTGLDTVTLNRAGQKTVYKITALPKTANHGVSLTEETGEPVYEVTCLKNGSVISGEAFEAFWNRLLVVTATGKLPLEWTPAEEAELTMTIRNVSGREHTVALVPFDALHDAMILDNCRLFYLSADSLPDFP